MMTACFAGGENEAKRTSLNVTSLPETYRYGLREIATGQIIGGDFGAYRTLDFMGDGLDEVAGPYSNYSGGGRYRSALLLYNNPVNSECLWERSQEFSGGLFYGIHCLDVAGNDKDDICIIRQVDTAIYLDIFSADDSGAVEYKRITAAVIEPWARDSGWYILVVNPLAGVDLNGDGCRDLIFSRSARVIGSFMKDSAFTRGMTAWDIKGDSLLWFLPLPDEVGVESFLTVRDSIGDPCFVFFKGSNNNPYEANGMHSGEAYLMGIDKNGRERWRLLTGKGFYGGTPHKFDADENGVPEIYFIIDGNLPGMGGLARLAKVDPFTGEVLHAGVSLGAPRVGTTAAAFDPIRGEHIIVISYSGPEGKEIIETYDKNFKRRSRFIGEICGGLLIADLVGDSRPEIIGASNQSRMVLLDLDMNVLAVSSFPSLQIRRGCLLPDGPGLIMENISNKTYHVIRVFKRAPLSVFYARYKWWLAVGLALLLFIILYRFVVWVSRLYHSAAGLPTLDKINAAVMVLDRKGKILFANKNKLTAIFLGENKSRGHIFWDTALGRNPAAGEILRKYQADPFVPIQGRLEFEIDNERRQVELSVFPRTGENHRHIIGSIIIVEDISERAAWNRKVVMGEAAQKWVHRLKGNMATAKIILENMKEDPRLAEFVKNSSVCRNYMDSLKDRIVETAQHSEKILRFVRINHPEPSPTDLNRLVDRVAAIYQKTIDGKIVVAKEPQIPLPLVQVDSDQITEVLDNLLSNAVDAVKEGGRITIKTGTAGDLRCESDGKYVEIIVEDNGRGISPEDREKIFIPGFTKSGRGTGLGLAIVKEIVHNHGGNIEVFSEIGKGTRFIVRLPATIND